MVETKYKLEHKSSIPGFARQGDQEKMTKCLVCRKNRKRKNMACIQRGYICADCIEK